MHANNFKDCPVSDVTLLRLIELGGHELVMTRSPTGLTALNEVLCAKTCLSAPVLHKMLDVGGTAFASSSTTVSAEADQMSIIGTVLHQMLATKHTLPASLLFRVLDTVGVAALHARNGCGRTAPLHVALLRADTVPASVTLRLIEDSGPEPLLFAINPQPWKQCGAVPERTGQYVTSALHIALLKAEHLPFAVFERLLQWHAFEQVVRRL